MKWYRRHRPKVHYNSWLVLEIINLLFIGFFVWVNYSFPEISVTIPLITHVVMAVFCYFMTRIWGYWIDNPEDYEKLQQARVRRIRRKLTKRDDKRREEKEKDKGK